MRTLRAAIITAIGAAALTTACGESDETSGGGMGGWGEKIHFTLGGEGGLSGGGGEGGLSGGGGTAGTQFSDSEGGRAGGGGTAGTRAGGGGTAG